MWRKLKTAAAVAGSTLAAVAIPGSHAAQATVNPGSPELHPAKPAVPDASCGTPTVTWQDRYDNRYLGIVDAGKANGNWASTYPNTGGCNQRWYAVESGYTSVGWPLFGMVNTHSDKCLAARGNLSAHVVQWSCGYNGYTYRWSERSDLGSYYKGYVLIDDGPGDTGWAACADRTTHWVLNYYDYPYPASNAANCVWH